MKASSIPALFALIVFVASSPCELCRGQQPPDPAGGTVRSFRNLGLEVSVSKDPLALSATAAREGLLNGVPVDLRHLEREELRRARTPEGRVRPELAEALKWSPAVPQEVAIWCRFDPDAVDFRQQAMDLIRSGTSVDEARAQMRFWLEAANARALERPRNAVAALGLPLIYVDRYAPVIVTQADAAQVHALATVEEIDALYPLLAGEPALQSAVPTHRWDRVYELGVRGDGITIAIVEDGGVSNSGTGISLSGWALPAPAITDHATMVAGVAASDHAVLPGHARGASIFSAAWVNSTWAEIMGVATTAISGGAEVLNMSWGGDSQRQLTVMDRYWDYQVRFNTVTVTVAAGNFGTQSGNVMWPALGWNVITVGNVNDAGTADWDDDSMNAGSSYIDPISAHGDRQKPEVSAVGTNVNAMGPSGTMVGTGTSLSAPAIAGIAACLMQADASLTMWPEAVKAILMAAATHNVEGASRLSDRDGAGSINGLQAYRIVEKQQYEFGTVNSSNFSSGGTFTRQLFLTGGDRFRAVLCWDSKANSSYATDVLDADLDLKVYSGQGTSGPQLASSTSYDNSYEIVEFCPPATGWYTLRISAYRFDGNVEPYGLAWTQRMDGRHATFRPKLPDVVSSDLVGPVIGNPNYALDPADRVNPNLPYACIASVGTDAPILLGDCQAFPINLDLLSLISLTPGNPWFHGFFGTLSPNGSTIGMHMSIPDDPALVGLPLYFGMVTFDPAAPGGVKELSEIHRAVIQGHASDLSLSDDGSQAINIPFAFPFFGNTHTICYVNANGNITFNGPSSSHIETVNELTTGLPRIAAFWDDLNPATGGKVRVRSGGSQLIVEWVNVPEYGTTNQNSVIVILDQSGRIELHYRDVATHDAIVGISAGSMTTPYPVDLSHGFVNPSDNLFLPPAIYEEFTTNNNDFDLSYWSDHRQMVAFTPTGQTPTDYRMTVDFK